MTTKAEAAAAAEELRLRNEPERQRRQRVQEQLRDAAENMGTEQVEAAAVVAEARGVLEQLNQKHDAALARQVALASARRSVGFAAHTGDAAARRELDALNAEGAVIAGEIESLAAAVEEGQLRVVTAEDGVRLADERRRAREVQKHLSRIGEIAPQLDQHLAAFTKLRPEFSELWQAIADLGPAKPRAEMVQLHESFALASALGNRGIKLGGEEIRMPPPMQRRTFADLVETWSSAADMWAARRLGRPDAAA